MKNIDAQHGESLKTLKTLWHPLLYHFCKTVLLPRDAEVEDEMEVTEQPPRIDLVLRPRGKQWTEEQRAVLPDGVRDRFLRHHLFEFKITESITIDTFKQADMYDFLYPRKKRLKDHEFQTYIVSSKTPLAKNLATWGYEEADYPGVYVSTNPRYEYIVMLVLNKLRAVPHNNYFRLFASRKKVRKSAFEALLQTHAHHLTDDPTEEEIVNVLLAVGKAYDIEVEGLDMEKGFTLDSLLGMGDSIRKSFIAAASPEERVMGLAPEQVFGMYKPEEFFGMYKPEQVIGMYKPEERMVGLKPEERVVGLKPEERLAGLSQEEKRLMIEELQRSLQMDESVEDMAVIQTELDQEDTADNVSSEQAADTSVSDEKM